MRKITKTAAAVAVFAIFTAGFSTIANAAPSNPPSKINCKKTSAKGHSVKNITPPEVKAPFKNRTFTLNTNCGDIVIEADGVKAPVTVIALAALASGGFYNQTICHRLTTNNIYVLQCGDPTATGSGGPNFSFRDENLPKPTEANYPAGVVAMANSGVNTNGSQFFIVYEDTSLPPSYTIWGKVTQGLDIVQSIAKEGVVGGKNDGLPKRTIAIEKIKVR
ncbi:MAG: peptidylprolyl isomerase [Actinobacteria bacterium]|nr:peptidylprolyl isomerase [Actinomycetota bacterium]